MLKTKLFYFISFLAISNYLYAQNEVFISVDSLERISFEAGRYFDNSEYLFAIESSGHLINLASQQNNEEYSFFGYDMLGQVYGAINDSLKRKEAYEKALAIAEKIKKDSLLAWSYTNLGNVYASNTKSYQKGVDFYKRSIDLYEKNEDVLGSLTAYTNIARTYMDGGMEDIAYPYMLKAQQISKLDSTNVRAEVAVQRLLGRYHLKKQNYTLARDALITSTQLAREYKMLPEEENALNYLVAYYEAIGDYELAFTTLRKQDTLSDRLFQNEQFQAMEFAAERFNSEQYKQQLQTAQIEKEYNSDRAKSSRTVAILAIVASAIFLVGLIVILSLFRGRKKYIKRLRQKNRLLIKAKEDAEHLSQLKIQFFSTVSHELRTPLYGVIGIASILLEDKNITSHRDDLKSLKFSADYLLALINDVLLMNKMDAKAIKLEHAPYKLSTLLNSIARSFEFSLEQNNNQLHLHIDKEIPTKLLGDSIRLSQVLMNLIGNAIKFNENGNIWVSITKVSTIKEGKIRVKFEIKDDGIGIPKNMHASIFEEFSQVENRNYNYQGTGLGLPIVKKLLSLYGSEIHLESDIGKGALFSFELDLERASASKSVEDIETINIESETVHAIKNVSVLIVDDNKINQKITQKILENRNFDCSLANDGLEAIEMTEKSKYDIILMDIHMPNIDGLEATRRIRAYDKTTPIIALTAVEIEEIKQSIYEVGMDDIILKPYDVSQFLATILRRLKKGVVTSLRTSGS